MTWGKEVVSALVPNYMGSITDESCGHEPEILVPEVGLALASGSWKVLLSLQTVEFCVGQATDWLGQDFPMSSQNNSKSSCSLYRFPECSETALRQYI